MRRTFLSIIFHKFGFTQYNNQTVADIVEGIQHRKGQIIDVSLSPVLDNGRGERLLVFYEDNNNYDEITQFLKPYLVIEYTEAKNELYK